MNIGDNLLYLCLREKYQDHILYIPSMHLLISDGFTVINFSISPEYI